MQFLTDLFANYQTSCPVAPYMDQILLWIVAVLFFLLWLASNRKAKLYAEVLAAYKKAETEEETYHDAEEHISAEVVSDMLAVITRTQTNVLESFERICQATTANMTRAYEQSLRTFADIVENLTATDEEE